MALEGEVIFLSFTCFPVSRLDSFQAFSIPVSLTRPLPGPLTRPLPGSGVCISRGKSLSHLPLAESAAGHTHQPCPAGCPLLGPWFACVAADGASHQGIRFH